MHGFRNQQIQAATAVAFLLGLALGGHGRSASAADHTELIARSFGPAPGANSFFDTLGVPVINSAGEVAFQGSMLFTGDTGVFLQGMTGPIQTIDRSFFSGFSGQSGFSQEVALNDSGQAAYQATRVSNLKSIRQALRGSVSDVTTIDESRPSGTLPFSGRSLHPGVMINNAGQVVYTMSSPKFPFGSTTTVLVGDGESSTPIASTGVTAPFGSGLIQRMRIEDFNNAGEVALSIDLQILDLPIGESLYRGSGGPLTKIAGKGQSTPGGNMTFAGFGNLLLNDSSQAAFTAELAQTGGEGLYLESDGTLVTLAEDGQSVPGGGGTFENLMLAGFNNAGQAGFRARLTDTGGNDDSGIYRASEGTLTQIVREGENAPNGGIFVDLVSVGASDLRGTTAINESGEMVFHASIFDLSHPLFFYDGIFYGNGIDLIEVVREGDELGGQAIEKFLPASDTFLNDDQQVAIFAELSTGSQAIGRFTMPDAHWINSGSGSWFQNDNWSLGRQPNSLHDAFIDPAQDLAVTVGGSARVRSLSVGGGTGRATLELQASDHLLALQGTTLAANGVMVGDGTVSGDLVNGGSVRPGHGAGRMTVADGDYTQTADGALVIDVAGTSIAGTDFDHLDITDGQAHLAGTLEVQLESGFEPNAGDELAILTAAEGVSGQFDSILAPIFGNGLTFNARYDVDRVTLFVAAQLLFGDANNDGQVTGADLLAVQQNFAATGAADGLLLGDATDDGQVTGADVIAVQRNFASTLETSATAPIAAPVPEPATLMLSLVGALFVARR